MSRFPFSPLVVLAPMEGITGAAVRALLAGYGPIGLVCTEFVRITGEKTSEAYLRRQVSKAVGVALSVQVMGNDAERMAEAGAVVAAAGADVVDVNLGCPTACAARCRVCSRPSCAPASTAVKTRSTTDGSWKPAAQIS